MSDETKNLIDSFGRQAVRIIGEGKRKYTDVVEWSDPEEARYNAKMGLDKYGMPKPVHKVLEDREESGYTMNLAEGFDLLGDDDYGEDDTPIGPNNEFFNPSGFNDW